MLESSKVSAEHIERDRMSENGKTVIDILAT